MGKSKEISVKEIKKMEKLYLEGYTCKYIGTLMKIERRVVSALLKKEGVNIDPNRKGKSNPICCAICNKHISNVSKGAEICGTCTTNIRRYRVKLFAVNYKGCKCENCGWSGNISGFDFHHIKDKKFNLSGLQMASMTLEKVKIELDKCKLLCAICHRLEHNKYEDEKMLKHIKGYRGKLFIDVRI